MGFLTKFRQTVKEAFNKKGKTVDPVIEEKMKEFEQFNKLIDSYKSATDLFIGNVYGMAQKHKRISKLVGRVYTGSIYESTAKRVGQAFDASGVSGEKSLIVMKGLTDMIVELKREVTKIRAQKRKREEARLLYDHYRVKIEKLSSLEFTEDQKKKKKYERNVDKNKKATDFYNEANETLHKELEHFMSKRNEFLSAIIKKFTQELEAGFYLENHIIMKSLDDIEQSLKRCEDQEERKRDERPRGEGVAAGSMLSHQSTLEVMRTGSVDMPNTAFFDNFQNDFGTRNSKQ